MALRPEHETLSGLALCAGVGGLELGLHVAEPGYRTVCYVERDVFPAATLVARMADAALDDASVWSDLRSFDARPWRGKVSVLTAGYPCQPFSYSGHRRGADDPRHLWPDVRRIAAEVRPRWCFCENVEGHITMGASEVIGDLRSMGYRVKAGLFSAREVGAGHVRRRLFIMAHSDEKHLVQPPGTGDFKPGSAAAEGPFEGGIAVRDRQRRSDLDLDLDSVRGGRREANPDSEVPLFAPAPFDFAEWHEVLARRADLQPCLFGLDHGMAGGVDRYAAAGNGVVSLVAAYAWRTLKAAMLRGITA